MVKYFSFHKNTVCSIATLCFLFFIFFPNNALIGVQGKAVDNTNINNDKMYNLLKVTNQRVLKNEKAIVGNKSIPVEPTTTTSAPSKDDCQNGREQGHSKSGGQHSSTIYTFIAVGCVTFASTISNLGMNLQKLALRRGLSTGDKDLSKENSSSISNGDNTQDNGKGSTSNRVIWAVGLFCIVMGSVGDFGALAFGAQSLIAPLSSLALVANIVIATWMHGEEFSKRDGMCTLVIISGCVVSVIFAEHKDCIYKTYQLFELFFEIPAICYFLFIIIALTVGMLFVKWIERVLESYGSESALYKKWYKVHRFSYASIAGTAGAQSVLLAKCFIEAVTEWVGGGHFFLGYWQMYLIIILLGLSVAMQIYWLNMGLARFDALYNVPVFQCFWMLFSTIGGGVFFMEFWSFSLLQGIMFPVGVGLCVFGVYLLSQRKPSTGGTGGVLDDKETVGARINRTHSQDHERLSNENGLGSPLLSNNNNSLTLGGNTTTSSDEGFEEIEIEIQDGHIGLGLYPDVVKIRHPKYSRVQCMVKVWRVKDFPPQDSGMARNSEGLGRIGQAEKQGIRIGMILVGIQNESLLLQKNMWGTAIEKLRKMKRPVTLTFRDISDAKKLSPSKSPSTDNLPLMNQQGSSALTSTNNNVRDKIRAHSFAGDVLSAGPSQLRKGKGRTASSLSVTDEDVMVAHQALYHRPMVGSTLNVIHAGQFMQTSYFDSVMNKGDSDTSLPSNHPMAEFAHHISGGFPPILDRVLEAIAPGMEEEEQSESLLESGRNDNNSGTNTGDFSLIDESNPKEEKF
jgi:magnesium transporter